MKTTRNIRSLRSQGFTLIELLVVISIIAILAGFALPVFSSAQKKGRITDSLNNAKQLGTALKMYAGDSDGNFPYQTTAVPPVALAGGSPANDAYQNLIPKYSTSKKIFATKTSAYCKPAHAGYTAEAAANAAILQNGSLDYNYTLGLSETSDSRWPLGCTATVLPVGSTTYTNDNTVEGGVWGDVAIVIFVDGSARVEQLDVATPTAAFIKRPDDATQNALVPVAGTWLSATNTQLSPL